ESRGLRVFEISAVSRKGLDELKYAMAELVNEAREQLAAAAEAEEAKPATIHIQPQHRRRGARPQQFTLDKEERSLKPLFRIRGETPERWDAQTNFDNDEAVGYLADRLERLGIENALFTAGARPGDAVVIGDDETAVVFDAEPTMVAGADECGVVVGRDPTLTLVAEQLAGPLGHDARLDDGERPTRVDQRQESAQREAALAAPRAEVEEERRSGLWTAEATVD